eukprot:CAMPEP_0184075910 /NCGR_PEP_ID=MMETSP0957-20130417/71382_1 /TAXON_ID=627963 /ORGANISM="Aplanochytrium sp, Strain PBS07" /LENGTH=361 /DNA_ID=CAMNT_0026378393 /DNA_START=447 /DNA_END=1532 /DNA_ORIENTATION=+
MNSVDVMRQAQKEFLNYNHTGMGFLELSHRDVDGPVQNLMVETQEIMKDLLEIPDEYHVLFMHGGAHLQFSAIPLNICESRSKAGYVDTGFWSLRSASHAKKYVDVEFISENNGLLHSPDTWKVSEDMAYVYFCMNETIAGLEYKYDPDLSGLRDMPPLICDATSTLLSRPVDISKYGAIFASSGKNLGPAGLTTVIVKDDLLNKQKHPYLPEMLDWREQANSKPIQNVYNTPPTFNLYMLNLTLKQYSKQGGLVAMEEKAEYLSSLCYDFIDSSSVFKAVVSPANKDHRSRMNVCFQVGEDGNKDIEREITEAAAKDGILQLFGHPVSGGLRITLYNAMPEEAVYDLLKFLENYESKFHR